MLLFPHNFFHFGFSRQWSVDMVVFRLCRACSDGFLNWRNAHQFEVRSRLTPEPFQSW